MEQSQSDKIRLNIDVPAEQHTLAKEAPEKDGDMDAASFKKGLIRIRKERYQLAKNLSKR